MPVQAVQTVGANLAINLEDSTGVNPQGSDAARLLVSTISSKLEEVHLGSSSAQRAMRVGEGSGIWEVYAGSH
jgi:hypothetical protein